MLGWVMFCVRAADVTGSTLEVSEYLQNAVLVMTLIDLAAACLLDPDAPGTNHDSSRIKWLPRHFLPHQPGLVHTRAGHIA